MARIIPDDWKHLDAAGAAARERETLTMLAEQLPPDYTVYHGVHWTRVNQGFSVFGEADFVVVGPSGRLMVIEQKSGFLRETPSGLVKVHLQKERNVAVQLARTIEGLQRRFTAAFGAGTYCIEALLYCPDYIVRDPGIAGVDPERIVDATRKDQLAAVIRRALPPHEPRFDCAAKLHHFLSDHLALIPDASALVGQADTLVTRLSGGLAEWARRLSFEPFRLRVTATAGAGKTQLAIQVMKDAIARRQRVLYVCFNRPLADHIARVASSGVKVATYHQLCDWVVRDSGIEPDFASPDVFGWLDARFAGTPPGDAWRFDVLIVDEGQDFRSRWVAALERLVAPGGTWWWLEDPMQNLYGREPVSLPGWVTLSASVNYRSPREIFHYLREVIGPSLTIESGSPFGGSEVSVSTYDGGNPVEATKRAITHALSLGFRKQDIALLSFRGREKSCFAALEQLGPHKLRSFTGHYDLFGNPEYRDGDVLYESIHRFKGQSAPCVILTEVDFDGFDERIARKFFVGATRATMKLIVVLSTRAAAQLKQR